VHEKSVASSFVVGPSIEVPKVQEHSIPETPRHLNNVIAKEEEEEEVETEPNMVSIGDDTDVTYHCACRLPYHLLSRLYDGRGKKRKQPVFSLESSETEFSSDFGTSYSICSPFLSKDISTSASNASRIKHEVVLIHLSFGLEGNVDVD